MTGVPMPGPPGAPRPGPPVPQPPSVGGDASAPGDQAVADALAALAATDEADLDAQIEAARHVHGVLEQRLAEAREE